MNEFFCGSYPVGHFVGGGYPTAAGRFAFEPYRGPGHYDFARTLRRGQPARCWFTHDGTTHEIVVRSANGSELVVESITPLEQPPTLRLIAQRMRNRIIEYLELASSFDSQREYERVATVHVPHEVINQWDDLVYLPLPAEYDAPVFTHAEREALVRYDAVVRDVCARTPNPLPALNILVNDLHWQTLRLEAASALAVFSERGKLPEDEEVASA